MGNQLNAKFRPWILGLIVTTLAIGFNNCDRAINFGGNQSSKTEGGSGYDGITATYVRLGFCAGVAGVESQIVLIKGQAQLTKQNCSDVQPPQPLANGSFQLSSDQKTLSYAGISFYEATPSLGYIQRSIACSTTTWRFEAAGLEQNGMVSYKIGRFLLNGTEVLMADISTGNCNSSSNLGCTLTSVGFAGANSFELQFQGTSSPGYFVDRGGTTYTGPINCPTN